MNKSFVNNPAPMIAGVVRRRTIKEAIAEIKNCEIDGADVIDLHLSCMDEEYKNVESIREIVNESKKPILALNYNQTYENENYDTDEEERVELLLKAAEAGVAAIDVQGYTYDLGSKRGFRSEFEYMDYSFIKGNPCEIVVDEKIIAKQCELIEKIHSMGVEVLFSCHPFIYMNTEQIVDLAHFFERRNPDIIKLVTWCDTDEQLAEAFKTMIALKREVKTPTHFHCVGPKGKLTRIVNPMLGSQLIFCLDRFTESSNFGQLDLKTAKLVRDNVNKLL